MILKQYWTTKENLIKNCRILKKLSYFWRFVRILKDNTTKPNGRLIIIECNI